MILAGLRPGTPLTDEQLNPIILGIRKIARVRRPIDSDWQQTAARHVPGARTCHYAAEDMSDLNSLLDEIFNSGSSGKS